MFCPIAVFIIQIWFVREIHELSIFSPLQFISYSKYMYMFNKEIMLFLKN